MVLSAPVMSLAALHWTGVRRFATATEPEHLEFEVAEGRMAVNQMSAAYVKAGTATVL